MGNRKTIVIDDDPTGTQSATGVRVLLDHDVDLLTESLFVADSVYVQTNSRALRQADAVALVGQIRRAGEEAARRLGASIRFVLRGDSTLRGHVFAETDQFLGPNAVMIFVPAFPDGGRTTRDGVHYVKLNGVEVPAHESEYAQDPVFSFGTSVLADYVEEKSKRQAIPVPLDRVRAGDLTDVLRTAPAGSVVLPDVVNDTDIAAIASDVDDVISDGRDIVVRSAAPLAATLAGVATTSLLPAPLFASPTHALLVCGSHTAGATAQLDLVTSVWGSAAVIDTVTALERPTFAGETAAIHIRSQLSSGTLAILASERTRGAEHGTLAHGEQVMSALMVAVQKVLPVVDVLVTKGGITSAEVARTGLGARSAYVLGQILPGISVWRMQDRDRRDVVQIVVPGNVGEPQTLTMTIDALGLRRPLGEGIPGGDATFESRSRTRIEDACGETVGQAD